METARPDTPERAPRSHLFIRLAGLLGLLYLFLVSIKLLETSIKVLGEGTAEGLFEGVSNPIAGLAAGILFTVLVQSSSVTTATIVALVGSNSLPLDTAVPMILGANIGTTVTNTLVSLGSVARRTEFRRAFAAATVHDFFNLIAVAVFLPLEVATGFLARSATWIAGMLPVGSAGGEFSSPIKASVKAGAKTVQGALEGLGVSGGWLSIVLLACGLTLIMVSLTTITRLMRKVIADKAEKALNAALGRSALIAIAVGALITVSVQSSSITTSLMVPLCASGVLSLENAFPFTLGANIGTTITAFLASLATDAEGLKIALVHVLFNSLATCLILPFAAVRQIPLRLARSLAVAAVRNKLWVVGYVVIAFVVLPVLGILLF
jgi:sodium-dependent phosphate cotransporter